MNAPRWGRQDDFSVRFEWGPCGVEALGGDVFVIVDVLRFTTAVEAAASQQVAVYPYRWRDKSAVSFAREHGARLADSEPGGPSLSPLSLLGLPAGTSVVLPSPNGSSCSVLAARTGATVVAACLRNAAAVSEWVRRRCTSITVIGCGERWPDGSLRPAVEDYLGAGAVLAGIGGHQSPEARAAVAVWSDAKESVESALASCSSGKELIQKGFLHDVRYASVASVSDEVPVLVDGAFRSQARAT